MQRHRSYRSWTLLDDAVDSDARPQRVSSSQSEDVLILVSIARQSKRCCGRADVHTGLNDFVVAMGPAETDGPGRPSCR